MSSAPIPALGKILAFAGVTIALAACSGGGYTNPNPPNAPGLLSSTYTLKTSITYPNFPPAGGAAASFDISFIDPSLGQYYLADRTTAGVDVIDTPSNTFLRTAGAGLFTGNKPNNAGGPNGVVSIGGGTVFAGDGNSTLKVVNAATGALLATQNAVNPYTGAALATCGAPTTGAANLRLDEMAYDPADGVVLAIDDASCPPFGTFFSTTSPFAPIGTGVAFLTANGGAEQPTWDPTQKLFIMALPSTVANPNGEIDLINATTHAITKTLGLATSCQPAGTALGLNETLFLGCGSTANILVVNATTGAIINTISGVGGCDETWYNPVANRFYGACSNNLAGPVLVVADGNGKLITTVATSAGAHSVAVDQTGDRVFVPTRTAGVAVYGH